METRTMPLGAQGFGRPHPQLSSFFITTSLVTGRRKVIGYFPSVVQTAQVMGVGPGALDSPEYGVQAPVIKTDINRGIRPCCPFPPIPCSPVK